MEDTLTLPSVHETNSRTWGLLALDNVLDECLIREDLEHIFWWGTLLHTSSDAAPGGGQDISARTRESEVRSKGARFATVSPTGEAAC